MDNRLKNLAEQLDAGLIARREFLRKAAVITGGTATGLHALSQMATAQPKTKLRVWLFKSYVTACNDILAKHVEAWAKERNVEPEFDWATFGDREQKFVAAIEAGNPPDVAEMNYQGPMRYRPALRDVTKLAKEIAGARGGLLPYADRVMQFQGQYFGIAHQAFGGGLHVRKDLLAEKGVKMPKVYDPDVIDMAKKCQDTSKDLSGFGQTLNRCDDGNGFMQNILWGYGGSAWDKDGKPALATTFQKQNLEALQFAVDTVQKHKIQPPGVMGWTDAHNNEAYMAGKLVSTNNGASLYYAMVSKKHPLADKTQVILTPGGPAGSFVFAGAYNWGVFKATKHADLCEDMIRWVEDEKRFEEFMKASIGQAGPVYKSRADHPYWKTDPNFEGMKENVTRSMWPGYPGPITPAAIEVQAQYVLCDMAGRVVVAGLSPAAALKEAHGRIEEIYKMRSKA
ncbi:MAG: ABC transporter substrate-binding protein [Candidatus Rokuibacteriota bacterium]|jgi:ABC-type glycerol-3-phosphate transport system substrate-binding protein